MKAYAKTLFRMLKRHLGRFIAVTAIIALGIGFMTGIGSVKPKLMGSLDKYFENQSVPDVIIKSITGFSEAELNAIADAIGYETMPVTCLDTETGGEITRIGFFPLSEMRQNKLELLEGRFPTKPTEIVVERETKYIKKCEIGDVISVMGRDCTVCGIVVNPLMMSKEGEPSLISEEDFLKTSVYFDSALLPAPFPATDVYVTVNSAAAHELFSKKYNSEINAAVSELKSVLGASAENVVFLTLKENFSAAMYNEYSQKVDNMSVIFSVFFVAVAVLVISTTMTRLVEEERSIVGCYKTLGWDDGKILFKYLFFAMLSCVLGSVCGILGITNLLVYLFYSAFAFSFRMPPMTNSISLLFGGIAVFSMLAAVLLVTWRVSVSLIKEKPAALLRPKSPKPGKKIFLERIGFFWKRLSFKYKSTFRNLFRYMRNFVLTIVSIAGSTALVFAGLGLYDSSVAIAKADSLAGSTSSMSSISAVLIVCAALLSILVIYNLTNINIEERRREIATLMVLGYKNHEVCGYIFREVFLLSLIGTALGIPLGYGFSVFVFNYIDFGSIADMHWYSWLGTAVLSLAFSVVVMLLLCRKIIRTDMNASLKTVD